MKDQGRQKGWVPISTYAFVEKLPKRLNFLEHLVPYKGVDEDPTIPYGSYGTASLRVLSYHAVHYARARKRIPIQLTVWYYLEEVGRSIIRLPRSLEECRGFMHTGRIASKLRNVMHEELLEIAATRYDPSRLAPLKSLDNPNLLLRDPSLIRQYMRQHKDVLVAVHPALQGLDPHQDEVIQIASFKLKRDRIKLVEAQGFDDIIVEI